VPPEAGLHVVLIDPSSRVRTHEMTVLRAAGMDVQLVTALDGPVVSGVVDVVVADVRSASTRPGAVLRLAFEFQRPVVVVTTAEQVDARLAALRQGAVDHVVAPTAARELIERVRHAARGDHAPDEGATELVVDRAAGLVRRGERSAALTPAEMALLEVLLERAGEVVTKAEIAEALPTRPRPNTIEVHLSALRRKLGLIGAQTITTVHGRGYLLRLTARSPPPTARVADLAAQRLRIVRERDESARRRDEIVRDAETRRDRNRPTRP
jgi:DNA-binding response OmpR family regulator